MFPFRDAPVPQTNLILPNIAWRGQKSKRFVIYFVFVFIQFQNKNSPTIEKMYMEATTYLYI